MGKSSVTRRGLRLEPRPAWFSPRQQLRRRPAQTCPSRPPAPAAGQIDVVLQVNGRHLPLAIEPRTSLLDALREQAGLTGTKKGCDRGACGACTVHIDGRRVVSCLTLAARCQGKAITTIEGLADRRRPASGAGRVPAARRLPVRLLHARPDHVGSRADQGRPRRHRMTEIREWMSGNICRCGAYPNIVAAIRDAAREG